MSLYRYSRWDGSQQLPPFDADDVLDALADDVLAEGDVRRALQRLMQRGLRGTRGGDMPGLRRIVDRLRERRQAELEQSHLEGVLDELAERVQGIVEQERAGDRAPRGRGGAGRAGRGARRRRRSRPGWPSRSCSGPRSSDATGSTRCRRTWPGGSTRCATTSSWIPARATPSTSSPMSCGSSCWRPSSRG